MEEDSTTGTFGGVAKTRIPESSMAAMGARPGA